MTTPAAGATAGSITRFAGGWLIDGDAASLPVEAKGVATFGPYLYVSDEGQGTVRRVDTRTGQQVTFAGNGVRGFYGDGGKATKAALDRPGALTTDANGNLYIADANNRRVRKVTPAGVITTVAGNGSDDCSRDGVNAKTTGIGFPRDLAVDGAGNLYLVSIGCDGATHRIRKVTPGGTIRTAVRADLLEWAYRFDVDNAGNVFLADVNSNRVRKVTPKGVVSVVAGGNGQGFSGDGGPAKQAQFYAPFDVDVDATGRLFIIDRGNQRIRRVDTAGVITTVAGNGQIGDSGDGGSALAASLQFVDAISVADDGVLYIVTGTPVQNIRVRKVDPAGTISAAVGNRKSELRFAGDGGPATRGLFWRPTDLATDAAGNVFVADWFNCRVRRITPAGTITTIAGNGEVTNARGWCATNGDGRPATEAAISPLGLTVDAAGDLYIVNDVITGFFSVTGEIRKIDHRTGVITTIAGRADGGGDESDGQPARQTKLRFPHDVAVSPSGRVYWSEPGVVRTIADDGTVITYAGTGLDSAGPSEGDGLPAYLAGIPDPQGLAFDKSGTLYIAETRWNQVRKVDPAGVAGTVAGRGTAGFSGDGASARLAELNVPYSVAVDKAGRILIADIGNNRVRRVVPGGSITTVAGNGTDKVTGDGGAAKNAGLLGPLAVTVDRLGNLFISEEDFVLSPFDQTILTGGFIRRVAAPF